MDEIQHRPLETGIDDKPVSGRCTTFHPGDDAPVEDRAERLHQIVGERRGPFPDGMSHAIHRIEPNREHLLEDSGQKDSVSVVKKGVKSISLAASTEALLSQSGGQSLPIESGAVPLAAGIGPLRLGTKGVKQGLIVGQALQQRELVRDLGVDRLPPQGLPKSRRSGYLCAGQQGIPSPKNRQQDRNGLEPFAENHGDPRLGGLDEETVVEKRRKGRHQNGTDIFQRNGANLLVLCSANELPILYGDDGAGFGDVDEVVGHRLIPVYRGSSIFKPSRIIVDSFALIREVALLLTGAMAWGTTRSNAMPD